MRLPIHQVDAFASGPFAGNAAAVVPLPEWPTDALLQAIAAENNLSETAYVVPTGDPDRWHLRWFTPMSEVDLCGHATLAAASVLLEDAHATGDLVHFDSHAGTLTVRRVPGLRDDDVDPAAPPAYELDFPARPPAATPAPRGLLAALGLAGRRPEPEVLAARDHVVVLGTEAEVRAVRPDFARLEAVDCFAAIVTAPGAPDSGVDFVSRFFAPGESIPEDPVTGSAHCTLAPLWAERLGRRDLLAAQRSARGGLVRCTLAAADDGTPRVRLRGTAVRYLRGEIAVPWPTAAEPRVPGTEKEPGG